MSRSSRRWWISHAVTLVACVWACPALVADEGLYTSQVKPILAKRCWGCHGSLKQEAGLRLDTAALILEGGSGGPAIQPGDSSQSLLIDRVTSTDEATRMPPEGPPLDAAEITVIQNWINANAPSPKDETPEPRPQDHWAFLPPRRSAVPPSSPWARNPIDAYIEASYRLHGLTPLDEAEPATLLRRVTIDLTGLPPTPRELHLFEQDPAPDRYERLVDRLLASPTHGERWGRHWMDIWRYSDWYGRRSVPDVMYSYPQIWRWRDWIVQALNEDRPYDRMIVAMLAADEASPGNDAEVVATGFLVRNWFKWNYENWMKDNVEHTAKGFLAITMNCCHCHDHKYDPITQEEYFRFRAFFEPLELRQDRVPGLPDPGPFQKYEYSKSYGPIAAGLIRVFDEKPDAPTYRYLKGDARNRLADQPPVSPGVPAILATARPIRVEAVTMPPEAFYPGLQSFIRDEERTQRRQAVDAAATELTRARQEEVHCRHQRDLLASASKGSADILAEQESLLLVATAEVRTQQARYDHAQAELNSLDARIAADEARYRGVGEPAILAGLAYAAERRAEYLSHLALLGQAEKEWLVTARHASKDPQQQASFDAAKKVLIERQAHLEAARTALLTTGDQYKPLSPRYPAQSSGRRLALARWIADKENPLTARVAVNHVWARHLGRGLVDTPTNFGRSGHPPTHPALLDWLALEFLDGDWQSKPLHRLLVTSATYRLQSGTPSFASSHPTVDPDNRWYGRAHPRRAEAEVVRDAILACANDLDLTQGGEEIDASLGLSSRRRSLYFSSHGEGKMLFLETFDAPDVCDGYERTTSIRPQQALALANSELTWSRSRLLAQQLWEQSTHTATDERQREFVRLAFEQVLGRHVRSAELDVAERFLKKRDTPGGTELSSASRAREALVHALFNHHDFVTIR